MAGNEITVTASLMIQKTKLDYISPGRTSAFQLTLNGTGLRSSGIASIPTTASGTAISMSGIATPGIAFIRNLDTTNYLEAGVVVAGTFYPFMKIKAGAFYVFGLGTLTPYLRANAAAVVAQWDFFED